MGRRPFRLRRCLRLHLSPHLTLGDKEPQPNTEAAAAPSLTIITYFTQKLVEKLYSGMFSADARHILLFITEHIMVVRTPLAMVVWKLPTTCPSDVLQLHRRSRTACGPPWKQDLRWVGGRRRLFKPSHPWWLWGVLQGPHSGHRRSVSVVRSHGPLCWHLSSVPF